MRVFFLFLLVFLSGCAGAKDVYVSRPALGTFVEITVSGLNKPEREIREGVNKAFAEINRIERLLSRFIPQSDIGRINTFACREPVKVTAETIRVLEKAIEFSRRTRGAFDVTIYPLLELWGITDKEKSPRHIPAAPQIAQALQKVGYQYIEIAREKNTVFFTREGMTIDLGGIAAGYAVDRAVGILKAAGISSALINAGGDIYALGVKGKTKWQIGLKHPRRQKEMLTILALQDEAVATSGDYQNFVEIEGRRYSHIVNPRTGYPCADVPASVTVISDDCTTADALSTALFVLGPQEGGELIDKVEGAEAIIVSILDGKLSAYVSPGIAKEVRLPEGITRHCFINY